MNKKGFTLIELLATVVVLAILLSISIYVISNAVEKSKEKGYKITVNEIEKNAGNYLTENNKRLFYLTNNKEEYEYQCITVENLVDYGYLDDNITESNVSKDDKVSLKDYIYIERDKESKTVTKEIYTGNLNDPNLIKLCDKAVIALGDISFTSTPGINTWSRYKDITITYRLRNLNDQRTLEDYHFNHSYNASNTYDSSKDTLENNTKTKIIRVNDKGKLTADIKLDGTTIIDDFLVVERIDLISPVIAMGSYTGNKTVRQSVTIPLKATDSESGVDYSSFTADDIEVTVGNTKVTNITLTQGNGENYNLVINSDLCNGAVKLIVNENKVFDNVENGNEAVTLDTGITFDNTYKITYDANGGTGAPSATTYTYAESGTINLSSTIPTKKGHTFKGWATTKAATKATYQAGGAYNKNIKNDVTLYAVWEVNEYKITYDANGGTGAPSATIYTYAESGTTNLSESKPTKTGYTFLGWSTKSNATKADYTAGQKWNLNNANDYTLYAVWQVNTYTITYHANGGYSDQWGETWSNTVKYGEEYVTPKNWYTYPCKYFIGWNEQANGKGTAWSLNSPGVYENGNGTKKWTWTYTKNIDLYAQWSNYDVVYVSSSGNDRNTGTSSAPLATINKAYACSAGTIKLLSDITQTTQAYFGTWDKTVTLTSDTNKKYIIKRATNFTGTGTSNSSIIYAGNRNKLTITNITFDGQNVTAKGSGITISGSSTATLTNITGRNFKNSSQYNGGFISLIGGTLTINSSDIYSNQTCNQGAGVYTNSGTLNVNNTQIHNNSFTCNANDIPISGGGIYGWISTINVTNTDIYSNSATYGGGICIDDATTVNLNSGKIYNNTATKNGGGVGVTDTVANKYSAFYYKGGSIYNNKANKSGGGVWVSKGSTFSKVANNIYSNTPENIYNQN